MEEKQIKEYFPITFLRLFKERQMLEILRRVQFARKMFQVKTLHYTVQVHVQQSSLCLYVDDSLNDKDFQ